MCPNGIEDPCVRIAGRSGVELVGDFTADLARPNAPAGLIGLGVIGSRNEGASLLGQEGGTEVSQSARE